MGIFKRIRDISLANIHALLDQLEDPIAMIEQYLRDLETEISEAEKAISNQYVLIKEHEYLISKTEEFIAKRKRQTELAIETENEQIAKQALTDKLIAEKKLTLYREQLETAEKQALQLQQKLKELKEKYQELVNKKHVLVARANVAQATKRINSTLASTNRESAAKGFDRMEERIRMMEAEAYASRQSHELNVPPYHDPYFVTQDEVAEELERMKKTKHSSNTTSTVVE
jgi:phage shock protein A